MIVMIDRGFKSIAYSFAVPHFHHAIVGIMLFKVNDPWHSGSLDGAVSLFAWPRWRTGPT